MCCIRICIGEQIRYLRKQRHWTQEVLGTLSELNRSYIGAVERGEHNIGVDNLERIALALEVEIRDIFIFKQNAA